MIRVDSWVFTILNGERGYQCRQCQTFVAYDDYVAKRIRCQCYDLASDQIAAAPSRSTSDSAPSTDQATS